MSGGGRHKVHKIRTTKLDPPKSDINVTPLVDVCLVLLIIFMVITPMMSRGREVPLPKTQYHYNVKDKQQPVVAIDAEDNLFYEKEKLGPVGPGTLKMMEDKVNRGWSKVTDADAARRIYIKADKSLQYVKVYPVIMYLHDEMGVDSVDLATNEKEAK
ncbi:MAG TPA: biopolymer transporter ExbD [Kofleriaceae bacterium]|nr:biopolymer transporter ExbD [Kofleriaceae bacterium]